MYEFTEDCMIHIDNIDEEHRKLFQMLNEAFALVKETDNAASIAKNLIDNLKDYAITHFAHEEDYMTRSCQYSRENTKHLQKRLIHLS